MNKGDLIEKVAKECGLSKTASDQVLNSILNAITGAVISRRQGHLDRFWYIFGERTASSRRP